MRWLLPWCLCGLPALCWAAEKPIFERGETRLDFGGYVRTLAAVQSVRSVDAGSAESGVSATLMRAEWKLQQSEWFTLEAHQRGYLQLAPGTGGGPSVGLGVSPAPGRTVNLRTAIIERQDLRLEHDLDRLVARFYTDAVDISVGRQAITWGTSLLFPVADLWTTLSPFELDNSQKRGIDAARGLITLGEGAELDVIIADRGRWSDLSAGARVTFFTEHADFWAAAAKQWNQGMLFTGVSADLQVVKLRGDVTLPYEYETRKLALPRATLGVDWLRPNLAVSVEGHFNGAGAAPGANYLLHASQSKPLSRGEVYLLGRYYAGAAVSWRPWELLAVSMSALGNLSDPSAMATAAISYTPTQAMQISLGAFQGIGKWPRLAPAPQLRSEFGSYGALYYLELSAFL